ncbi:ABC transporter substrate-binding protein [Conexibacter arvalis]|uniref:Thiamine pyrimidine synthase n=1 Tax=Conexibacter arvalis TaxID=912552 RepID=A0A840IL71_9ACTN|nr:ABC transporter substrate-binding protein [Conexibacter arvalis]MBB4664754.1 NitT/TauT family transport system substrate-binding protein [Conexibacter arvalis]
MTGALRLRAVRLLVLAVLATAGLVVISGCGGDDDAGGAAATTGGGASGTGEVAKLTLQYNWTVDEGLIGEVAAIERGFFADEGIELEIRPGGPSNDGVASVASGRAQLGIAAESPPVMLAASQGIPVQAFAAQLQAHPYAYFALPGTKLDSAADLSGKTVGVPPPAVGMLDAYLKDNGMTKDDLAGVTSVSFDVGPLLQRRVDVWGGWLTDRAQLRLLPDGYHVLRYADSVPLYGGVYYANPRFLDDEPELAQAFMRAAAKGWRFAREHPQEAARIFVDAYPNAEGKSTVESIVEAERTLAPFMWTDASERDGYGTMTADAWQQQLDLWEQTGQFDRGDVPTVDDVMTLDVLDATRDARTAGD